MDKVIYIQDEESFFEQIRIIFREEIASYLNSNILPQPQNDEWLTREQVLQMLNICPATLHKRQRDGTLKPHRVGRRIYFLKSEILNK